MTTYVSLAASATMFPTGGTIRTSPLTTEQIRDRMAKVPVVSALNPSHATTVDAIRRRYDLALPVPDKAAKVQLVPGDELFIIQASLPRLAEGQVHSDETVASAPISFLRWRVPVAIEVKAPALVPQRIFEEIVDDAYAIALWRRGEEHLKDASTLLSDLDDELEELDEDIDRVDAYLEASDCLYKALCHWYVTEDQESHVFWNTLVAISQTIQQGFNEAFNEVEAFNVMLAKMGRRVATGGVKDHDAERELARQILREA
jgi:hypothetical protein